MLNLQALIAAVDLPDGTVVEIVDEAGYVVARSVESEVWVGQSLVDTPQWAHFASSEQGTFSGETSDGVKRLIGYSSPASARWRVSVGIPAVAAYPNLVGLLASELGILICASLLIGHLVFRLGSLSREHLRQKTLLRELIDSAPFGVAVVRGPDHVFELVNPAYRRIPGMGR